MSQSNSKEKKTSYTTGIIPTFTFVADGPEVHSKHGNGTKHQNTKKCETINQFATTNDSEQKQQGKHQKENCNAATKNDLSGPLHITPSWQPLDANDRPPYSYSTLIAHSILSSEHRRLTLCDIYQWITQHYPFYSMNEHGWKNSIRHNLSLNKAFVRIQRSSSSMINSGKGSFWTIRPGQELAFIDNLIKRRGPIRKQPVMLPQSLRSRRSSRRDTDEHNYSSSFATNTRHINNSPLFTTFRMTPAAAPTTVTSTDRSTKRKRSMPELRRCQTSNDATTTANDDLDDFDDGHDSDCDSGIDVSNESDKTNDRCRRYSKPQLKKAKSTPCLSSSDPLDTFTTATPPTGTFQDLLSGTSDIATLDYTSSNWTDHIDWLSISDSFASPFLDWTSFSTMTEIPAATYIPPDFNWYNDTTPQNMLISPTFKPISASPLDSTSPTDTFSSLDALTNNISSFEKFAPYNTTDIPPSSCVDSFFLDDFLLDDQTPMADWNL